MEIDSVSSHKNNNPKGNQNVFLKTLAIGVLFGTFFGGSVGFAVHSVKSAYLLDLQSASQSLRQEVLAKHPELLAETLPYIDCAVSAKIKDGQHWLHWQDPSHLKTLLRVAVTMCAQSGDLEVAKTTQKGQNEVSETDRPQAAQGPINNQPVAQIHPQTQPDPTPGQFAQMPQLPSVPMPPLQPPLSPVPQSGWAQNPMATPPLSTPAAPPPFEAIRPPESTASSP